MLGAISPGRTLGGVVPFYSLTIVLAIGTALFLCFREERRLHLPKDTVIDLALWLIPVGIIGARLYYVVFSWDLFASDPKRILYVWEGGIAIYGAIVAGVLTCWVFARKRQLSVGLLIDLIMPALALAQAIGRWGNYFNMEAYGAEITAPWLQFFPFGVLIPENGAYVWHLATFFYESIWDLSVFLLLWKLRRRPHRAGDLGLWYILLYGSGRMIIEGLRMDSLMAGSGLRVSQGLSLLACLAACMVLFVRSMARSPQKAVPWLCLGSCLISFLILVLPVGRVTPWLALTGYGIGLGLMWLRRSCHLHPLPLVFLNGLPLYHLLWYILGNGLDPILYSCVHTALAALIFPAAGALLYFTKEVSPCET